MILELLPDSDPMLHEVMPEFVSSTDLGFVQDMIQTLLHMDAYGLAANQCGIRQRVFVLRDEPEGVLVCVNPRIVEVIDEKVMRGPEGCLSFPDLILTVDRPTAILAEWFDVNQVKHERVIEGFQARGFQHELDHLNGITFVDRVSRLQLDMALKRKKKLNRR